MTTPHAEPAHPARMNGEARPAHSRDPLAQLAGELPLDSPLLNCWNYSTARLQHIAAMLAENQPLLTPIETIAVSGSFGRMEGSLPSDFDLMVIGKADAIPQDLLHSDSTIRRSLSEQGLKLPGKQGVFSTPLVSSQLFAPHLGEIAEAPQTFGIRIQLLLDAQPLSNYAEYRELQRAIIRRYLTPIPISQREACWTYLLTDLARYFRSLSLKYQWEDQDQFPRWGLRVIKGRFSRPLMYVALTALLGESLARGRDPESWVCSRLHLTPLERLAECWPPRETSHLQETILVYREYLKWISDSEKRLSIAKADVHHFSERADQFHKLLIEFLLSRRGYWPPAFANRLFF